MSLAYIGEGGLYLALLGFLLATFLLEKYAKSALNIAFICAAISFGLLMGAFIRSDFSYLLVVDYSHTLKPLLYKAAATWGNHEGSMLLWLLLQSGCAVWYARKTTSCAVGNRLYGFLNAALCAYIIITSNPFHVVTPVPLQGMDLNPVLQDPLLSIHPPILYFGYILGSILWVQYVCDALRKTVSSLEFYQRISLFSLAFVTLGVGLGSFWAYYELGWGGFWFWDPVESLSLLPWLILLTVIHQLRDHASTSWMPFVYLSVLFTTFMVRSGALTSVHSFADDPIRGQIFGIYLFLVCVLTVFAVFRHRQIVSKIVTHSPRSTLLEMKKLITGGLVVIILLGVGYPIFMKMLGKIIILGQSYFTATFVPLSMPLMLGITLSPWCHNKRKMLEVAALTVLSTAAVILFVVQRWQFSIISAMVLGLSIAVMVTSIRGLFYKSKPFMHFAHFGFGFLCLGIALSTTLTVEKTFVMHKGQDVDVQGYTFTVQETVIHQRGNHHAVEYPLMVKTASHKTLGILHPELRYYTTQNVVHAETSILNHGVHHIYGVVVEEAGQCILQVHIKPYINIMWLGVVIMVIGLGGSCYWRQKLLKGGRNC